MAPWGVVLSFCVGRVDRVRLQVAMLNKFSEAIRGTLSKMQRLKVVALVTIEVHARDIIEKLIKVNCSDVMSFDWLSQLRLYWDRVSDGYFQRGGVPCLLRELRKSHLNNIHYIIIIIPDLFYMD